MTNARFILLLAAFAGLVACSEKPEEKRTPDPNIEQGLKPAEIDPLQATPQGIIQLKKSALGKAYLVSTTLTIAWSAPILDHLQPVVVSFERSGNELGMFELNTLAFYNDLPANKLLRTFKIASESDDAINFKWDYGLEYVSTKSLGYYSDMPANMQESPTAPGENVTPVVSSFVRGLTVENNTLHVTQVSRLRDHNFTIALPNLVTGTPVTENASDFTVTLDFRIRPYLPNKNFVAKASELKSGVGFFEQIGWNKDTREMQIQAQRWDMSPDRGPITYAITKNVPSDYVDAVKEGVLYWNKVIGYEAVKVVTGADPREAAQDRRIVIHWIDWDDAGFARASLQADPLTGELISGNVYMTSVFAVGAKMSARQDSRTAKLFRVIKPAGIPGSTVCALDVAPRFFDSLPSDSLDEATLLRAAQDQVRVTVAHEVGHTLGLRHNFAGSIGGSIRAYDEYHKLVKDYFKGVLPSAKVTTTVMDYEGGTVGSLIGAVIRNVALTYDVQMMKWSRDPALKAADIANKEMFCTDGDLADEETGAGKMVGCEQFDEGTEPLAYKAGLAQEVRDNLAIRMARSLIVSLRPLDAKLKKTPAQLLKAANALNLDERAMRVVGAFGSLAKGFQADAKHINTYVQLGNPGWMNAEEWKAKNAENIKAALASFGGLSGALSRALPVGADGTVTKGWLATQIAAALENPELKSGVTLEGMQYELTNEERDVLAQILTAYGHAFEEKYTMFVIATLTPDAEQKVAFDGAMLPDGDSAHTGAIAASLIGQSDSTLKLQVGEKSIEVAKPAYSMAVRGLALRLLQPAGFGQEEWAAEARASLQKALVDRVKTIGAEGSNAAELMVSLKKLNLTGDAKKWATGELALIAALDGAADAGGDDEAEPPAQQKKK